MQILFFLLLIYSSSATFKNVLFYNQGHIIVNHFYNFDAQQLQWNILESVRESLNIDNPAHRILWELLECSAEQLEQKMAYVYSIDAFFSRLQYNTLGCIVRAPKLIVPKSLSFPEELKAILDPKSQISQENLVNSIKDPLKRLYAINAHKHFQLYRIFQNALHVNTLCSHIIPQVPSIQDAEQLFNCRIDGFFHSIPELFMQLDYHVSPIMMAVSWSLAQYLKYMTRFFPDYKTKVNRLLIFYSNSLDNFCQRITKEVHSTIKYSLESTNELKDVLVSPVPALLAGPKSTSFHCVPVKLKDGVISLVEKNEPSTIKSSILVYVTENSISDPKKLHSFLKSVIAQIKSK